MTKEPKFQSVFDRLANGGTPETENEEFLAERYKLLISGSAQKSGDQNLGFGVPTWIGLGLSAATLIGLMFWLALKYRRERPVVSQRAPRGKPLYSRFCCGERL